MTHSTLVKATLTCVSADCFGTLAAKPKSPTEGAYPCELVALSSELLASPDGGRLNMRLIVRNPTAVDFDPFDTIVSPAVILQGRPVGRPPAFLIHVNGLKAGEVGVFYFNDVPFELPSDRRFTCHDKTFAPAAL